MYFIAHLKTVIEEEVNSSKVLSEYPFPQVPGEDEEWVVTDVIEETGLDDNGDLEVGS